MCPCICVCAYVYVYVLMYMCICVYYVHMCISICMYKCICLYMRVFGLPQQISSVRYSFLSIRGVLIHYTPNGEWYLCISFRFDDLDMVYIGVYL